MAKASWCTVTPMSGSKNGSIAISASAHTGRTARTTNVTVVNTNGTQPTAVIAVNQAAASASFDITNDQQIFNAPTIGGIVTITGTSNCKRISVDTETGVTKTSFKVNSVTQTETDTQGFTEYVITGDPGASALYNWELKVTVPANTDATVLTKDIDFTAFPDDTGSNIITKSVMVEIASTASTVSVLPTSVSLVNAGTAQNVAITSNDNWTVS